MWCEYGWSVSALRGAFEDIGQVLTDMGTEFGLVDYINILPAWLRSRGITCSSDSDIVIGSGRSD
eukprot:6132225-Prorocentrum_lima.AAC.1